MPKALSMSKRISIIHHRQAGKPLRWIAQQVEVSYATVQQLCTRHSTDPESGLIPHYSNCGKVRRDEQDFVYRVVRCMKTWHPSWGAEKIRCELIQMRPDLPIPKARMLQKWFHWNGQATPRSHVPTSERQWAKVVHQGWQVDAKEEISIAGEEKQSWLNIVDECSSGVIDAGVFPLQKDLSGSTQRDSAALDRRLYPSWDASMDQSG